MNHDKDKKERRRHEIVLSIAFALLMLGLSWTKIVYIPISEHRMLDISLVPVMFAAMIGGYQIAIPVGLAWAGINYASFQDIYDWYWIIAIKMSFSLSIVYFYRLFKRAYKYSPWNVYRTIWASLIVKNAVDAIAMLEMFPNTLVDEWMRANLTIFAIQLAISMLAMSLIVDKLRQIHILNGIKRKEKVLRENSKHAHLKQH
jgi:hypothetical protein